METRCMHKQCVPGPLLSYIGPGNKAGGTTSLFRLHHPNCVVKGAYHPKEYYR